MLTTIATSTWIDWLNANQGVLAVALFVVSAAFAWFSGIISALRRRPILKIDVTPGPTMCTVTPTGREHEGHATHRTCISLYLHVANAGSAPTSIGDITLNYHWPTHRFGRLWWIRRFRPHTVLHQSIALQDFQARVSVDDIKFYPFLTQKSAISGKSANTYLEVGEMTNGVVYFEETEGWGACQPKVGKSGTARMRVNIKDAFGHTHRKWVDVPLVPLSDAKKYNPSFGESLNAIRAKNEAEERSERNETS
jgi:hypothetical protein